MALQLSGIRWNLDEDEKGLLTRAAKKLGMPMDSIRSYKLLRCSTDARKKEDIHFLATLQLCLEKEGQERRLLQKKIPGLSDFVPTDLTILLGTERLSHRPVVVGSGPAGLFATYLLAKEGYCPIVIERGASVEERQKDVQRLWQEGELDEESNVQFGEGGAGTFSDGKLTSRSKDPRAAWVLDIFCDMGAPADIAWKAKAHIGTDCLTGILQRMRQFIIERGGSFHFRTKLVRLMEKDGRLTGLQLKGALDGDLPAQQCILAIGHSARDTYTMLRTSALEMEAKPFAVGLRMEHPQELIDRAQFGKMAGHPKLGAAEYQLSAKTADGRGVYSFCMCPGGRVVCAASEAGHLAVNGMSHRARDEANANAAIVVQVNPVDCGADVLSGMVFQRRVERAAFLAGGGAYLAPVQRQADFLAHRRGAGQVTPLTSYRPGAVEADLWKVLPSFCARGIEDALPQFARKIKGFDLPDALLIGVETRTSAPVRILRGEDGQSNALRGLYPTGEGAGYAGGIVSAAVDGLKMAEKIISRYAPWADS